MDQRRQSERRQQEHLAARAIDIVGMNVTPNVAWNRLFGPLPLLERAREKFEPARRRRKTGASDAIDFDADRRPTPRDDPRRRIDLRAFEVLLAEAFLVQAVRILLDQECAVLAHVSERRESFLCRRFGQAGHAMLEDPLVVFIY